jgi:tRNA(Ser,Leu) C12 N-acetylase TAN1
MNQRWSKQYEMTDGSDDPEYTVTIKVASRNAAIDIISNAERIFRKYKPREELPGQQRMPL